MILSNTNLDLKFHSFLNEMDLVTEKLQISVSYLQPFPTFWKIVCRAIMDRSHVMDCSHGLSNTSLDLKLNFFVRSARLHKEISNKGNFSATISCVLEDFFSRYHGKTSL